MNLKSKFLVWYERLININYGKEFSENKINRFKQLSDIKYIENKFYDLKEKIGEEKFNHFVQCTILKEEDIENRIRGLEEKREMELEILKKTIPKKDLKDGVWYDCDESAKHIARFYGVAQWIEKEQQFLAPGQQQFGMDGILDHFEDVINTNMAGFAPMWEVNLKNEK
jgi:hypothetical protein